MTGPERASIRKARDASARARLERPEPRDLAHLIPDRFEHIPRSQWGQRPHGTEVKYVHDRCKCGPCREAHRVARERRRQRQLAQRGEKR